MGWVNEDDPAHEGYVVALVEEKRAGDYRRFRELGYPDDDKKIFRVKVFQAGCECGWRSRRFFAPLHADWSPFSLELHDEEAEEEACQLWRRHCEDERRKFTRLLPWRSTAATE